MKRVFDHIRDRLLVRVNSKQPIAKFTIADLEKEWSTQFEILMRNRLMMGALRYGPIHAPGKKKYDRVEGIRTHISLYESSGNLEHLVDCANLCLMEFEEGTHPNRHFHAIDEHDHHCK